MEDNRALIGALIFIFMVLGANLVMYAITRGVTRSKRKSFLEMVGRSIEQAAGKKDDPTDELHRRINDLSEGPKGGNSSDPE